MKRMILATVLALGVSAFANHDGSKHEGGDGPCKPIKDACQAAGFEKGKHKEGKGLHKDCTSKILKGEQVAGVTVNAADIEACKAHRAEHKGKGKGKHVKEKKD